MRLLGALGADADHEHDHFQEPWPPPRAGKAASIGRRHATNFWDPATVRECLGTLPRAGRGAGGSWFLWGGAGPHPAPGVDLGGLRKHNSGVTSFQTDDKASLWRHKERGAAVEPPLGQEKRAKCTASRVSFAEGERKAKAKRTEDAEGEAEELEAEDEDDARDQGLENMSCQQLKAKEKADEEDASAKMGNATDDEEDGIKKVAEASTTTDKKKKLELEEDAAQREEKAEKEADTVEEDMEQAAKIKALIKKKCGGGSDAVEDEQNEEPADGNAKKEAPKEG